MGGKNPGTGDPLIDALINPKPKAKPKAKPKRTRQQSHQLEKSVLRECRMVLKAHPKVVYSERRSTGMFTAGDGSVIQSGVKGASDLWCVLDDGRHVEIECKRRDGKGRVSKDQKKFGEIFTDTGLPWVVVTSGKILKEFLDNLTEYVHRP